MSALRGCLARVDALVGHAFRHLRQRCARGERLDPAALDAVQVPSYDLAFSAAELAAARAVQAWATGLRAQDPFAGTLADLFASRRWPASSRGSRCGRATSASSSAR